VIPRDTVYRLAHSPRDLARCKALLRARGEEATLSFPTVLAERAGEVIGFLATQPRKDAVVAGPIAVAASIEHPAYVVIRLAEAYDAVMRKAGITLYYAHIATEYRQWADYVERVGLEPWHRDESGTWFKRRVA
jgi:hypothetical protein